VAVVTAAVVTLFR